MTLWQKNPNINWFDSKFWYIINRILKYIKTIKHKKMASSHQNFHTFYLSNFVFATIIFLNEQYQQN